MNIEELSTKYTDRACERSVYRSFENQIYSLVYDNEVPIELKVTLQGLLSPRLMTCGRPVRGWLLLSVVPNGCAALISGSVVMVLQWMMKRCSSTSCTISTTPIWFTRGTDHHGY